MSHRSRWFEYLAYRPVLEKYYAEDPNFRWEAAPKPRLTEHTYKKDWHKIWNDLSEEERSQKTEPTKRIGTKSGMISVRRNAHKRPNPATG